MRTAAPANDSLLVAILASRISCCFFSLLLFAFFFTPPKAVDGGDHLQIRQWFLWDKKLVDLIHAVSKTFTTSFLLTSSSSRVATKGQEEPKVDLISLSV